MSAKVECAYVTKDHVGEVGCADGVQVGFLGVGAGKLEPLG